ncbi:S-isoprenylcysteine O-methyltransferase [Myriangium duriaei CBS 260.36]|uniref:Protein-S-isoprenylcysteine O-methyltransferase n=1 Tax=Myriangium duriaei CBS 260.36 TaxID=1168546 RepID=A0A9P4J1K3_9PEZI|nr:S-isoprenylcysteine O-methyltransferase [Myriangium duriaei CBS 260.36]
MAEQLLNQQHQQQRQQFIFDADLLPTGKRSLSLIAGQAFLLGLILSLALLSTLYLALHHYQIWRLPTFISFLCTFHFLEFYTTAQYNTPAAKATSFLLYSNGWAWNAAHSCAMFETIVSSTFAPTWQTRFSPLILRFLAAVLVVVGQTLRSTAMAQAGTNFNHIPAQRKEVGHVLVSEGVYALTRHPSYAGFFWWALGTQLLVGNKFCFVAYAVVLWRFFDARIRGEEKNLVRFFGEAYVAYKQRTGTGIPLIK